MKPTNLFLAKLTTKTYFYVKTYACCHFVRQKRNSTFSLYFIIKKNSLYVALPPIEAIYQTDTRR